MDVPAFHILPPAIAALLQVILIDIVLAGDNAVVIGVSAAKVPVSERRRVMFWGLAAAVVLRLAVAYAVLFVLRTTFFLVFAGGLLLLWVSWRLYREIRPAPDQGLGLETISDLKFATEHARLPGGSLDVRRAVTRIAVADLSMSLDNVLAVAGAAMNHVWVLAVGLLLSIALMGLAASLIARLLQRMPWISYAGVIIVLYVALRMIWFGAIQIYYAT
ncbi:MAG: YjbE family putative metal transport protein [Rhizomicrobium sp.]